MKAIYYLFILSAFILSCDCTDSDDEKTSCFEFDRRQCDGDEWSEIVPINDSEADQEKKMEAFLESKDIAIQSVSLVIDFQQEVCEACFVCPEGDRFFVSIVNASDSTKLADLELLALEKVDCSEVP